MTLTVTVTNDAFPKDQEFDIPGLGMLVNGKATEIDEDTEHGFVSRNMQTVKDAFKDSENIKVEGTSSLSGGVKGVLGVDPSEISDMPSLSPVEVAAAESTTPEAVENNTVVDATVVDNSTDKKK